MGLARGEFSELKYDRAHSPLKLLNWLFHITSAGFFYRRLTLVSAI